MEDFECGKKTRRKLRLNEVKNVQVDTTDPIETAFTSGQFGHGSRVFAKVRKEGSMQGYAFVSIMTNLLSQDTCVVSVWVETSVLISHKIASE